MQGKKEIQEKLFYQFSLSSFIAEDNYYRKLNGVLDLNFLHPLCLPYYSQTGCPSVDPEVFFKMLIYGYNEGITSDRELVRRINDSFQARYFIGYDIDESIPHHSSLSRTRSRLPEDVYSRVFIAILDQCVEAGLVSGTHQGVDSTLVKANASLESLVPKYSCDEYLSKTLLENESGETNRSSSDPNEKRTGKGSINKTHRSKKDPDARVARKPGFKHDFYFVNQISVDSYCDITTAVLATKADVNDAKALLPIVEQSLENLNQLDVQVSQISADKNYYSAENLFELDNKNVTPYISKQTYRSNAKGYDRSKFVYDPIGDQYICPNNKALTFRFIEKGNKTRVYKPQRTDCNGCKLRSLCTKGKELKKITHSVYYQHTQAMELRSKSHSYKLAMKNRLATERVFGDAKNNRGMTKINVLGLSNAQKTFTMIALVQNLNKLLKYGMKKSLGKVVELEKRLKQGILTLTSAIGLMLTPKTHIQISTLSQQ